MRIAVAIFEMTVINGVLGCDSKCCLGLVGINSE